jgi:hypothetical protein
VLIQCFERRCLTYTPANAPGWQVEMGNVVPLLRVALRRAVAGVASRLSASRIIRPNTSNHRLWCSASLGDEGVGSIRRAVLIRAFPDDAEVAAVRWRLSCIQSVGELAVSRGQPRTRVAPSQADEFTEQFLHGQGELVYSAKRPSIHQSSASSSDESGSSPQSTDRCQSRNSVRVRPRHDSALLRRRISS